ncbi:MAG TPA: hypothetical protein VGM01_01210 [Ktedonobacteraceae bacterium]|jgi:hypothetical protein
MGQYQQWLAAQEIDRRLRAEIDTLETEYFYLQDRITILEQVVPATENVILQALTEHLQGQAIQEQLPEKDSQSQAATSLQAQPVWSELPRLETPPASDTQSKEAVPYLPHAHSQREMSEDMLAFFDKRSQTDPKLSALLQRERQRASTSGVDDPQIDEETRRLNENIQRWFTRWHRQIASEGQTEGIENEQ